MGTGPASGRDTARSGWDATYRALVAATRAGPVDVEDLERLAAAAFLVGRESESAAAWEHAHRIWLRLGDVDRAARCAFWLGLHALLGGDAAPANGWFTRGGRLVAEQRAECVSYGYLLVPAAMEALEGGDPERAAALYTEAGEIAARFGDADLLAISRLGRGEAALASGETRAGLALLDEVMVAATTGEVSPITTGILYCAVIDACMSVFDVRRAGEWTEALTRWCDSQQDLVPYRGTCLVHRSQVMQAHGAWGEALVEATRAREQLARTLHPAVGGASYQLGELHRLRGEYEEAERAYRDANQHGAEMRPGLALLRLAQGKVGAAQQVARRLLDEARDPLHRLAALPAFVEIALEAGDRGGARAAADELSAIGNAVDTAYVCAVAAHAQAAVRLAERDPAGALAAAREACRIWRELGLPYDCARSQVVVALACRDLGDPDAADVELESAALTMQRLGAAPDLARVASLRDAAAAGTSDLTARECDVLRLVAAGSTNREIGATLGISEHTVARHLQNIFAKLGVSSRAAATAHAYEHGIV